MPSINKRGNEKKKKPDRRVSPFNNSPRSSVSVKRNEPDSIVVTSVAQRRIKGIINDFFFIGDLGIT